MGRSVVLAGCGDVGICLGQRLVRSGWRATGIRRRAELLPAEISPMSLDLTNPGSARIPKPDAVVVSLTTDAPGADAYAHTHLGGLRGLARVLGGSENDEQPRVVLISSTGVFGQSDGETITEETVPRPRRETSRILLEAEGLVTCLFRNVTIIRPAGIYGPGRGALIDRVRRGVPLVRERMTNRIHRDDLVTVVERILEVDNPPSIVHAVDRAAAPLGEVADHIASLLGVPEPPAAPETGRRDLGKTLDGSLAHSLVRELQYPTFREGYAALLTDHD